MAPSRSRRRSLSLGAAAALSGALFAITACSTAGPAPAPSPWEAAPTDGTWERGDVSFGAVSPIRELLAGPRDEYTFQISAAPTLTTDDDGESIIVSSTITVVRVHDQGSGDDLSDSETIIFIPGERSQPMNEAYGAADVVCENDQLAIDEATTCTITFEAEASEVQNSYWDINRLAIGTWPSQLATGS